MADKDSEPRNPMKDFGWLAIFLIVLGVIWFAQGGATKLSSTISPFLQPPTITSSGSSQGNEPGSVSNEPSFVSSLGESPYKNKVSFSTTSAKESDPDNEYLEIRANYDNTEAVPITGWTLKGKKGMSVSIGSGAYLAYAGQVNAQESIFLGKNGNAVITTGQSPIGTNFRLNICTGYFSQFQTFYPGLPQTCPRISDDEIPATYPDACFNFINGLSTCRMPSNIPYETSIQIGNDCLIFIQEKANYSGCVNGHKNDPNFYKTDWRIYLNRNEDLWGNLHDNIILLDQNGKLVDYVLY